MLSIPVMCTSWSIFWFGSHCMYLCTSKYFWSISLNVLAMCILSTAAKFVSLWEVLFTIFFVYVVLWIIYHLTPWQCSAWYVASVTSNICMLMWCSVRLFNFAARFLWSSLCFTGGSNRSTEMCYQWQVCALLCSLFSTDHLHWCELELCFCLLRICYTGPGPEIQRAFYSVEVTKWHPSLRCMMRAGVRYMSF